MRLLDLEVHEYSVKIRRSAMTGTIIAADKEIPGGLATGAPSQFVVYTTGSSGS
jgi:hypothetical protein